MKTSIAIIVLLFVNTTALLSEPFFALIKSINIWYLLAIEIILVLAYFINKLFKNINEAIDPDFNVDLYGIKK